MSKKWKILKWCLPVISYLIFIGLFYFWDMIDRLIWGVRYNGVPLILPYYSMVFIALLLIPRLYAIQPTGLPELCTCNDISKTAMVLRRVLSYTVVYIKEESRQQKRFDMICRTGKTHKYA
jgi:hypothetical protein